MRHRRAKQASLLESRLDALHEAFEASRDRLPEEVREKTTDLLERASSRRSYSADHVVAGFFGATGSGKSSLFNAVVGRDHARVAATRPTTSSAMAAVSGTGAGALLDWLEVPERHFLGDGTIDLPDAPLILLDLPDFDSTATEHRDSVDRLAGQVDALIFVLDPQKYADAVVHRDFLAEMSGHDAVTLIVLNQIDTISESDRAPVIESLRSLMVDNRFEKTRILATSAVTGEGIDELRTELHQLAEKRQAMSVRLNADLTRHAEILRRYAPERELRTPGDRAERSLAEELAGAAGVETVARAVFRSDRLRALRHTGWPVTRWLARFRPDPLRRLNLRSPDVDPEVNRTSLPPAGAAQQAQVARAVRQFAEEAGAQAPADWSQSIARAAMASLDSLPDRLDEAIAGADLGQQKSAWWWPVVSFAHWIALGVSLAGGLWLLGLAGLAYLQFEAPPAPTVEGFPVPTLMLVVGLVGGILLAAVSRFLAYCAAASSRNKARQRMSARVAGVATDAVIDPVHREIDAANAYRRAIARVGKSAA